MKTPHEHAALIKAWADGAEIEIKLAHSDWSPVAYPTWNGSEYRIKPEPKPDVVRYGVAALYWGRDVPNLGDNLKITYDGATGNLKAAEVLS